MADKHATLSGKWRKSFLRSLPREKNWNFSNDTWLLCLAVVLTSLAQHLVSTSACLYSSRQVVRDLRRTRLARQERQRTMSLKEAKVCSAGGTQMAAACASHELLGRSGPGISLHTWWCGGSGRNKGKVSASQSIDEPPSRAARPGWDQHSWSSGLRPGSGPGSSGELQHRVSSLLGQEQAEPEAH